MDRGPDSGRHSAAARHGPLALLQPDRHLRPAAHHPERLPQPRLLLRHFHRHQLCPLPADRRRAGHHFHVDPANRLHVNENTTRAKDLTIARRLITIAVSDFLCWFPSVCWGCWRQGVSPSPERSTWAWPSSLCPLTQLSTRSCTH